MCGRVHITLNAEQIQQHLDGLENIASQEHDVGYNLAPSKNLPVVINAYQANKIIGINETSKQSSSTLEDFKNGCKLTTMKWGLKFKPSTPDQKPPVPINLRDDTLLDKNKNQFKGLKNKYRCLIPAQGFYEWKRSNSKLVDIEPYYTHLENSPIMLIAALYHMPIEKNELPTFAMITTEANSIFKNIHHRMPLMFNPKEQKTQALIWLSNIEFNDQITALIYPFKFGLNSFVVSNKVNDAKKDEPTMILPVKKKRVNTIDNFFKKEKKTKA